MTLSLNIKNTKGNQNMADTKPLTFKEKMEVVRKITNQTNYDCNTLIDELEKEYDILKEKADKFDELDNQNSILESRLNKYSSISDTYAKQNAFSELEKMMRKFKSSVR